MHTGSAATVEEVAPYRLSKAACHLLAPLGCSNKGSLPFQEKVSPGSDADNPEYTTNPFMMKQLAGKAKCSRELAHPSVPVSDLPPGSQLDAAEQHPKATQKRKHVKLH